jgi:Uncharacterized conserved protein (COG2071)
MVEDESVINIRRISMRLPIIHGLIRRRLLINYLVEADVGSRLLPKPFRLKLHRGYGIASICIIRLEQIRPGFLPRFLGCSSENVAHRIAVIWDQPSGEQGDGVFILRRDTNSWINHYAGGRIFPGEQKMANFAVTDSESLVTMSIRARDGRMAIDLSASEAASLPSSSCFDSLANSSSFFQAGSVGYSVTRDCCRFDGMRLESHGWDVRPLTMERLESSFFDDETNFPEGSVIFDHALIMRNLRHEWYSVEDLRTAPRHQAPAHALTRRG